MKKVHSFAKRSPGRGGGFSLIELMVVLVIAAITGTLAFGGWSRNKFSDRYKTFVEDLSGAVVQARNMAIDEQTRTELRLTANRVQIHRQNSSSGVWEQQLEKTVAGLDGGILQTKVQAGQAVCLYGLQPGVQPPSQFDQSKVAEFPTDCLGQEQVLEFGPDGRFKAKPNALQIPGSGITLWVADRSVSGKTKLSAIQIFPGGLVRTFEALEEG